MHRLLFLAAIAFTSAFPALAQSTPEVLILGSYHMANPGRDLHNVEADDVLSARRQREIAELIGVLHRFRPTKVAVEVHVRDRTIAERYARYRAGGYQLTRNETDQIGLRLAKDLEHAAVHPVDEDGEFPYLRLLNYAKANGLQARFDSIQAAVAAVVAADNEFLRGHTILEMLTRMNTDEAAARGMAGYYAYVPFGEPWEYAGPELLARWFERNIKIYRNIRALATFPGDRILVVMGAGHLGWLRQNVANDPSVRLRTIAELLDRPR